MSNDAKPETLALARRGLPLASPTRAPLRGAWLPSAARNAATASPLPTAPAAPEPASQMPSEEPWWMEAAEWVPREQAEAEEAKPDATVAARSASAISESPGSSPRPQPTPASQPEPLTDAPRRTSPMPGAVAGREIARSPAVLPAAPQHAANVTSASNAVTPRDDVEPPRAKIEADAQAAAQTPAVRDGTPAAHTGAAVARQSEPAPIARVTTARREPSMPTHAAPAEAAPALAVPSTVPQALEEAASAPAAATPSHSAVQQLYVDIAAPQGRPAVTETSQPAPAQRHAMGAPHALAPQRAQPSARTGDLAALLASPGKSSAPQIRIDRIAVTVQAPAPAAPPPAAPRADAAATRTAAPAAAFRNPWSGYHARRD